MVTKLIQIAFNHKGTCLLLLRPANEESCNDVIWRIEINLSFFFQQKSTFRETFICYQNSVAMLTSTSTHTSRRLQLKMFSDIFLRKVATFGCHVVPPALLHALQTGTIKSDNGDGNENIIKVEQNNNFVRAIILFVHLFAVTAWLYRKNTEFKVLWRAWTINEKIC